MNRIDSDLKYFINFKSLIILMANTHITINQYEELLNKIKKLESGHKEIPINELAEKYYKIEKDVAVTDTKFDSLDEKIDFKFDSLQREMHNEFRAVRTELRITLGAIFAVLVAIGIKLIFYS